MRIETGAAPANGGVNAITALRSGPGQMPVPRTPPPAPPGGKRRLLGFGILGWTALVGFTLWWLMHGHGLSVWIFQEGDLSQPGFSGKVQSVFRGELGLQRTYPWLLFAPYLALMAWYFPLERERLRRNLPLNAAAGLAFVGACQAINLHTNAWRPHPWLVNAADEETRSEPEEFTQVPAPRRFAGSGGPLPFRRPPSPPPRAQKLSLRSMTLDLLAYGAMTGLAHSVSLYGRLRERERRALVLESHLAKARLNTLQAQLQPHFLFNSLNAIVALLRRDPRVAETTLVSLSELLRLALSQSERQELALREELEFVQRYLAIQQTRFGDKLRVELDIEPQALDCQVPTLVLQPLVENAIRHGIEPAERSCLVRISACRQEGQLVLTVEDDGAGLVRAADASGSGIGLANLRERLQALYGVRQKLELTARAEGGVRVRVEIPWQQFPIERTDERFGGERFNPASRPAITQQVT